MCNTDRHIQTGIKGAFSGLKGVNSYALNYLKYKNCTEKQNLFSPKKMPQKKWVKESNEWTLVSTFIGILVRKQETDTKINAIVY